MKLTQLLMPPAHVEDMDGFAGGASLRDHRYGITRHDDCIGKREKTKIGIFLHPIPEEQWHGLQAVAEEPLILLLGAARSCNSKATAALVARRQ